MPIRNNYSFENVEGARVGRLNFGINTTFIVYRIDDTVIDCGPPNQWKFVKSFLAEKPIRQLLITHHHEDHSGNAASIAKTFDLLPFAPALSYTDLKNGFKIPPVQKLVWGNPIPVKTQTVTENLVLKDGNRIFPVHTPGHAYDLTCYFIPGKKWLFSGDLYISRSLRYLRADENLEMLIESIRKVLKLDFEIIFCPHRGIVEDGKSAMNDKLNNLISICEQAQSLRSKGLKEKQIVHAILGKEDMLSYMSGFDICKTNLIREALKVRC